MRAIAEFAMRSRWHAIGTSMVAAILPLMGWLTTVIVALVSLRFGASAGAMVLLWAMLPVGVALYFVGDPSPMIAMIGTFLMAMLLRHTLSWELVLIAAVFLAAIGAFIFEIGAAAILERFASIYVEYLAQIDSSLVMAPDQAQTVLLGFFALGQAFAMVVMLIIARWCQSALYNPGGFGKEFRALRLSPVVSGGSVAAMLVCYLFNEVLGRWLPLLTVPLVFAAIGLVHWVVKAKEMSGNWLAGFYVSMALLFQLIYPFLASLALMDSWFNIRNRIQTINKD
ncbi:MAG: hypothetical protein ISP91_07340 [Pseudomonadales bacterium]|nr:hypothetical protein [Pseudomonadales bacterium]